MEILQPSCTGRFIPEAPSMPDAVPERPDWVDYRVLRGLGSKNFWLATIPPTEGAQPNETKNLPPAERVIQFRRVYAEDASADFIDTPI